MKSVFGRMRLTVIAVALMAFLGAVPMLANGVVYADAKADICNGIAATGGSSCTTGGTSVDRAVKFAIQVLGLVAGVVGVVMIIIGGMKYMTSQGDGSQISAAKNTIIYAIVGLVIAMLSQFIVHFVMSKVR